MDLVGLGVTSNTSHETPGKFYYHQTSRRSYIFLKEENAKEHKTLMNSLESSPEGDNLLLGDDILEVLGGPGGHVN